MVKPFRRHRSVGCTRATDPSDYRPLNRKICWLTVSDRESIPGKARRALGARHRNGPSCTCKRWAIDSKRIAPASKIRHSSSDLRSAKSPPCRCGAFELSAWLLPRPTCRLPPGSSNTHCRGRARRSESASRTDLQFPSLLSFLISEASAGPPHEKPLPDGPGLSHRFWETSVGLFYPPIQAGGSAGVNGRGVSALA
jgi:hypothetical protein